MNIKKQISIYTIFLFTGILLGRFSLSFFPVKMKNNENTYISQIDNGNRAKDNKKKFSKEHKNTEKFTLNKVQKNKNVGDKYKFNNINNKEKQQNFNELKNYAKQESVKSFIHNKFDNLADYEVVDFLKNYIHISDADIPKGVSAVDFAGRLGEIFTNGVDKPINNTGINIEPVEFDVATNSDFQAATPTQEFKTSDNKIYASFNTENYQEDKVMVKWYRVDDPKVYIFDKYDISNDKNNNFVWLEKPSGWNEGLYGVEIYSMEDNLSLMAYGEYSVVKN